jgi:hypothetical protein
METIEIKVKCCREFHTIKFGIPGYFRMLNHDSKEGAVLYGALSGEVCKCLLIAQDLKSRNYAALPDKLRKPLEAYIAKLNRQPSFNDPLGQGKERLRKRLREQMILKIRSYINDCSYRRARGSWAGGNHYVDVKLWEESPAYCDISGESQKVWSSNGKWSGYDSNIKVNLDLPTWLRVDRAGLSIVSTKNGTVFVLKILEETSKGILVIAGKQRLGFDVRPCSGIINVVEGKPFLKWQK